MAGEPSAIRGTRAHIHTRGTLLAPSQPRPDSRPLGHLPTCPRPQAPSFPHQPIPRCAYDDGTLRGSPALAPAPRSPLPPSLPPPSPLLLSLCWTPGAPWAPSATPTWTQPTSHGEPRARGARRGPPRGGWLLAAWAVWCVPVSREARGSCGQPVQPAGRCRMPCMVTGPPARPLLLSCLPRTRLDEHTR
jgi:hypothetical protein